MNRHQLAQHILPGLLASGHFTEPAMGEESPWFIVEAVEIEGETIRCVPVVDAAYVLADLMLKKGKSK